MKVKPYIKQKPLQANEIRVISVDQSAIAELLAENLMKNKSKYFDVPAVSGNDICLIKWDTKLNFLTYAIMPIEYCFEGYDLNPDFIRKIGITTDSLFKPNRYRVFKLTDEMLTARQGGSSDIGNQKDGSVVSPGETDDPEA